MLEKKFGMLTPVKLVRDDKKNDKKIFLCVCDCGSLKETTYKILRNKKKPRSCGCSRKNYGKKLFESNFTKTPGCWVWKGTLNRGGYGKFRGLGAHRASYMFYIGKIPKGKYVCHNCPGGDNPACVNPDHLWLGTAKENTNDMVKKLRGMHGTKSNLAFLNEEKVLDIRRMRLKGSSYKEIAEMYNISWVTICSICKNRSWKHVPLGEETKKVPQIRKFATGERCASTKLTENDVKEIRKKLSKGERGSHIARKYGVNASTISDIKNNNIWKNI